MSHQTKTNSSTIWSIRYLLESVAYLSYDFKIKKIKHIFQFIIHLLKLNKQRNTMKVLKWKTPMYSLMCQLKTKRENTKILLKWVKITCWRLQSRKNLNSLQKMVYYSQIAKEKCSQNNSIKFEKKSIKSSLCDYSHAFILVTGDNSNCRQWHKCCI